MNTSKHLILNKGQDITANVKYIEYNPNTQKYNVTFLTGKTYSYAYLSIDWLKYPKVLSPILIHIKHGERELFNIQAIYVFNAVSTRYWRIRFTAGSEKCYDERELDIKISCLSDSKSKDCLEYLRQIATISELRSDDGTNLLQKQYERLGFVGEDTALAIYLNPLKHKSATYQINGLIFPFGGNTSQFKAVDTALRNQLSVIQGPPGTGKTQTILNIIANLLVNRKTVLVVSNNNSATDNVLEKLSSTKYGMGFLVAPLGKRDNKDDFINNQTGKYPSLATWEADTNKQIALDESIKRNSVELTNIFIRQELLSKTRQELEALTLEIKYFKQYLAETGSIEVPQKLRRNLKSEKLMQLWQECNNFAQRDMPLTFWYKIKSVIIYGISDWKFYKNSMPAIITLLQSLYYQTKHDELTSDINKLINELETANASEKMDKLTTQSMEYLRAKLFEKYGRSAKRVIFSDNDLWKNPETVVKEYPIVLSTTFSSRSSLKDVIYDYLIMDEASQIDVATGALSLSCAKNAVIVGDLMQLPNVVSEDKRKQADAVLKSFKIQGGYSYTDNSFLKSISTIIPDVPQTLLREHYRCHPKIIGFCNQKFYQNKLIIMTNDNGESDTLSVYKTAIGNHRRDHDKQRQIDVVCHEVLPKLLNESNDIGIIAPYNEQVNSIIRQISADNIDVATVHKFQGREKDTIIISSVDNVVTEFSDDSNLLNVAISRAKKRLYLVVSGNEQPGGSNIRDLISYIQYNNFEIVESEIYSVFDYLYKQYTTTRLKYLSKHNKVSEYDSENLMYLAIKDIFEQHPSLSLDVICHQPLNMLIHDAKYLNEEECKYAMNTATHVDFLIYNRISKKPIFAVEVDGFHNHKDGSRQAQRDRMKDRIFGLYGIPLLRFPTNGSREIERIEQFLVDYENKRMTLSL